MIAYHLAARPDSRLFHGKLFFLGGSTDLERPGGGVRQGDLSGIAALEVGDWLRPYTFPPLDLALETDWDRKLTLLAERSLREPITLVGGVPSWLLMLFERLKQLTGKATLAEVWPALEMVVHGGVKFDPYRVRLRRRARQRPHPAPGSLPLLRGLHRLRRPGHRPPAAGLRPRPVLRVRAGRRAGARPNPTRHWLGTAQTGVNYAIVVSTCAGMWSHIIGDTVRFESLDPPLLTFTGRTKYTLSAFGEHLISEEVEDAIAAASTATGAAVRDWHVGPVFQGGARLSPVRRRVPDPAVGPRPLPHHPRRRPLRPQRRLQGPPRRGRRPAPAGAARSSKPGGFDAWMRSRGKLGGQHKVPRMDNAGTLTADFVGFLRAGGHVEREMAAGEVAAPTV